MKKRGRIILVMVIIIALIFFFRNRISHYDSTVCSEFRIEFVNADSLSFITSESVRSDVRSGYQAIEGSKMSDIDLNRIREVISANPYVSSVSVFKSLDAVITAEIVLREPLIRVFDDNGNSYMVDRKGELMPVPVDHSYYLICVTGCVPDFSPSLFGRGIRHMELNSQDGSEALNAAWMIASVIDADENFSQIISQIHVVQPDSVELIPAIGDFIIQFGKPEELEEKLEKLSILYSRIIPYVDMNQYTGVDITIKNQFVFQKNISYETEREQ